MWRPAELESDGDGRTEAGLRRRVARAARSISGQHRQLDTLHGELVDALDRGDGRRAKLVLLRFGDALEAHFSLEDGFFFPALHGLHPACGTELAALSREHERFDAELAEVSRLLREDALGPAAEALETLAAGLTAHEKREETLLRTVAPQKRSTSP